MTAVQAGLWIAVGIHWLPLPGLLGPASLVSMYGLEAPLPPSVALLLQHRALLFALLSLPLALALRGHGSLRTGALLLLASDLAFAALCLQHWPLAAGLQRVLLFDLLSIGLLAVGLLLSCRSAAGPGTRAPDANQTLRR
ncbi:MAG: hypothetical protein H4O13_02695 [Xanthomonadales bacterium]|nr:hypothetical protein [Xanthomonadales bacterium]